MPNLFRIGMLSLLWALMCFQNSVAGGFDSSGQMYQDLFGEGHQVALSYKLVAPKLSLKAFRTQSDSSTSEDVSDMAKSYTEADLSIRFALSKQHSCLFKWDQPFRFKTQYRDDSLAYQDGEGAEIYAPLTSSYESQALSALCRIGFQFQHRNKHYEKSNFYWIIGTRYQEIEGVFSSDLTSAGLGVQDNYHVTLKGSRGWGYSLGLAYEKPEIAFRFSIIYHSEIHHDLKGDASAPSQNGVVYRQAIGRTHTPQSVNMRLQSGLNESWLGFINLRWGDWSKLTEIQLDADVLSQNIPLFESDTLNYQIGVAKKLSDRMSVGGYFGSILDLNSKNAPPGVDGTDIRNPQAKRYSIALGMHYALNDQFQIGLGGSYFYLNKGRFADDFYNVELENSKAYAVSSSIKYRF